MYIPKVNAMTDEAEAFNFMQRYPFAIMVTVNGNWQTATHLPFTVCKRNDCIVLTSHMAKANPQWKQLMDGEALVIFSEPHAYISPKHYDSEANVPTWNYLAVHAYGKGRLLVENEEVFRVLEETINRFEPDYLKQWDALSQAFKLKMRNGIVAFEIEVTELQGKKKLSQNRSEMEKQRIADALTASSHDVEKQTGVYMKKELIEQLM